MRFHIGTGGLLTLALFLAASTARADRVPSRKVPTEPARGPRPDITVYYGTNGIGTLGVYDGTSPRMYSSPIVDDPKNPQARPVYNLQFYGAKQSFGDKSNGSVDRTGYRLVPPR